jgi:hypothetical protein
MGPVMMMPRLSLLAVAVLAATALFDPAQATSSNGVASQHQWSAMDKCTKQAIARFPDHTAEALAKRDEFTRQCQRDSRVPVREGMAPK